jgi:hypothetical protein
MRQVAAAPFSLGPKRGILRSFVDFLVRASLIQLARVNIYI